MKSFSSKKYPKIIAASFHLTVSVDVCNCHILGLLMLGNLGFGRDSSAFHVHILFSVTCLRVMVDMFYCCGNLVVDRLGFALMTSCSSG